MSSTFLAVRVCTLPLAVQTRDVGILWRQVGDTSPANRGLEEERWRREVNRDLESSVAVIFSLTTMPHPVKAHDAIVYLSGTNITRCCRKINLYFTLFSIYIVLYLNISTVKRKKMSYTIAYKYCTYVLYHHHHRVIKLVFSIFPRISLLYR